MRKMTNSHDEILKYALKLLTVRDHTQASLKLKLIGKFGEAPDSVFQSLLAKRFLNDRRYAENYVSKHKERGKPWIHEELVARGIEPKLAEEILSAVGWPSLRDALAAKMADWKLRVPLQPLWQLAVAEFLRAP